MHLKFDTVKNNRNIFMNKKTMADFLYKMCIKKTSRQMPGYLLVKKYNFKTIFPGTLLL